MKPPAHCNIDPRQLAIGKKIEMEHTNNPKEATTIATHHICEFGSYYKVLPQAERKMAALDRKAKHQQQRQPAQIQRMKHARMSSKPQISTKPQRGRSGR